MNNRHIKKVAVLGSGIMGSRIACHFANAGCAVLLLDIVPRELTDAEKKKNLGLDDKAVRNRIVNDSLKAAVKSNPSPIYSKKYLGRIQTGNFEDDMDQLSGCDWILEAVIERLDIKQSLFEKVDAHRKPGTLVTTNTSGIPVHMISKGRSDDFRKHFFGTHFFNPPRYLELFEIIPGPDTDPGLLSFISAYAAHILGKTPVICKDTPAFIANRVGIFGIMSLFHNIKEMGLSVTEVDQLTGTVLGRPKSATFRTCDVVGLDTVVHVADGLKDNCPGDEAKDCFEIPDFIADMVEKNRLGSKTGAGFYKKEKNKEGEKKILALDLQTHEYHEEKKSKFATLEMAKPIHGLAKRMPVLYKGKDKAGAFFRNTFNALFAYVSRRIPEIADELYKIDDAMRAGFGWKLGPFEVWDAVGVEKALAAMGEDGNDCALWVRDMVASGCTSFYHTENGRRQYYSIPDKQYKDIPGQEALLDIALLGDDATVWKSAACRITDMGDGILHLGWQTKMNTIGGEVLEGINKAIDLAEAGHRGLVIHNGGDVFSAGANVGLIFMMAIEQEFDELDFAIRSFQNTMMRVRYSAIPVVAAPKGLTLGGGCELCLHADKVVAHAETYIGLVELGVGVIPAGGGTKEFTVRFNDDLHEGDIRLNQLRNRFLTIGQAKVATSAVEGFELGYFRPGRDEVILSRQSQLAYAKQACLAMADKGYTQPLERRDVKVLGKEGLGIVYAGANAMKTGHFISEHDALISEKLGNVMCGGPLSQPTEVSERYLLDLERKAFLELCMERKTLERLESIIKTGKVLRN